MIIWTFRIQKLKIGSLADFEKKSFSSLFLMRKPLSSDQKWFLRPYFPLIGGIFVLKSGLRFLFRALEVPIRKVRKRPFFTLSVTIVSFISCGCNVFNSRLYFGEPMEWGSHKTSLWTASFTFLFVNKLNPRQISKHGLGFAKSF